MPYYPKSKYSKPKNASLGTFAEKVSQKPYSGTYVKTYDRKYYSGDSPMATQIELEKITSDFKNQLTALGIGLFGMIIGGIFSKILTPFEIDEGEYTRYIIEDNNTGKIVETDRATYQQVKKDVPNITCVELPWIIKAPAADVKFGKYIYKGSESRNIEAVQALQSQVKGLSSFIKDYTHLSQEPKITPVVGKPIQDFSLPTDQGITNKSSVDQSPVGSQGGGVGTTAAGGVGVRGAGTGFGTGTIGAGGAGTGTGFGTGFGTGAGTGTGTGGTGFGTDAGTGTGFGAGSTGAGGAGAGAGDMEGAAQELVGQQGNLAGQKTANNQIPKLPIILANTVTASQAQVQYTTLTQIETVTQTFVEQDYDTQLENSRKANFDLRK